MKICIKRFTLPHRKKSSQTSKWNQRCEIISKLNIPAFKLCSWEGIFEATEAMYTGKNVLFINKGFFLKKERGMHSSLLSWGQSSFMGMNFFCNSKLQMRFLLLKRKIVSSCNLTWNLCPFHFDIFFSNLLCHQTHFLSSGHFHWESWITRYRHQGLAHFRFMSLLK